MITLYHCLGSRSSRVLWTVEALELEYKLHILPAPPRVRAPGYLELNPLGTVPLLIDGNCRMTESVAICHYLATSYGDGRLAVHPQEAEYGRYLNYVTQGEATLTFPLTLVFRYTQLEPPERRNAQVADDYARWFLSRLKNAHDWSAATDFLCGGRLTVADISVGYAIHMAELIGLQERLPAGARDYLAMLKRQNFYDRAVNAEAPKT